MSRITRRQLLQSAAGAALAGCAQDPNDSSVPADPLRPNVLVVLLDQLRSQALSLYGETNVETPAMDRLLLSGASFRHAITPNPVCTPARAGLLTGRHPHRDDVLLNFDRLPDDVPIWPEHLADAGYRCGWVGKWHLDDHELAWVENRRCFDWWRGFNMGHFYQRSLWFEEGQEPVFPEPLDRYQPEYQTEHALDFVDQASEDPWMLVLSYGPPHPNGPAPVDWTRDVPAPWFEGLHATGLDFRDNVPDQARQTYDDPTAGAAYLVGYYAALRSMDHYVDVLLSELEARGVLEDTLVIFLSDHGELGLSHGLYGKRAPLEEAIRVPVGFSWPGQITPTEVEVPFSLVDLGPTVLGFLDLPALPDADGRDLSSLLRGDPVDDPPEHSFVAGNLAGPLKFSALASATAKVARTADQVGLWDLQADPYELVNLAEQPEHADWLDEMLARLDEADEATGFADLD